MLETSRLVVFLGTPAPAGDSAAPPPGSVAVYHAEVHDAATGQLLGNSYRLVPASRWRRWFAPEVLAVHEADDEPLVFTVQRPWRLTRTWEVRDADGYPVGLLYSATRWTAPWVLAKGFAGAARGVLWDRFGHLAGLLTSCGEGGDGHFRTPEGAALASVSRDPGRLTLTFGAGTEGDPILRMLLLAAVLVETLRNPLATACPPGV